MKIRLFNTYEPVTSLYRDLVPHLHEQGIEIEIVVSKGEYRRGRTRLKELFADLPNVKVVETPNFGFHAYNGALGKVTVILSYLILTTLYTLFGAKADKNLFLTQPPFIPLLGYMLSIFRRQSYYCVVMDIQPQLAVALGLANGDSLITKSLTQLSNLSLRKANGVIVIGRCMTQKVLDLGVAKEKIHFVANWANETNIVPIDAEQNRVRQAYNWQDKFVVMYAGNIGIPQYFDDLLTVAEKLQTHKDLLFVFIGEGARRQTVDDWIATKQLANVVRLPFLHDTYELSEILGAGDVHIVTLRDACTGWAVPSKSYGVLAAGRPLIYQGKDDGEIALMVEEEQVGTFVATHDVNSLENAILDYYDSPTKRIAYGQKARELATQYYSCQSGVSRYSQLLLN